MKRIDKKLKSSCGEMLMETLVAILIVAVTSIIFVNLAVSASRINEMANSSDDAFNRELEAAEKQTDPTAGEITVNGKKYTVNYYGGSGKLTSFAEVSGG